jgi:multisubunit Na+/H+ antiporter MnhB subunit
MGQSNVRKLAREKAKKQQNRLQLLLMVGGGLILLVTGVWFALFRSDKSEASTEVVNSPRLQIDKEVVDLGEVTLGNTVEVTFKLTNIGDQPLRFSEAPYIEVIEGC